MHISVAKVGWCVFFVAAASAILGHGQDDSITAAMKSSGTYLPILIGLLVVLGLLVIRLGFMMRQTLRMGRQLEELRNRKGGR